MKTLMNIIEIKEFINNAILNGAVVKSYIETACIRAEQVTKDTTITTILANGKKETSNIAISGDWIITNPGGEQYVVPNHKFIKKYKSAPELGEGWFKPLGQVQKFIEITEDLTFICSWGEEQFINKGGFINITNLNDIYGIARQEFFDTYSEYDDSQANHIL